MAEYWDIYDVDRGKTGRRIQRGVSALGPDEYHVVIHVCLFNAKGEMLIQQRQSTKAGWPNKWDVSVGGSAVSGENSQSAAQRELAEELGIRGIDFKTIRPHFTVHFEEGFDDFYLIERDIPLSSLRLQEEEVQAVRWASKEEILEMIASGAFIPYTPSLIALFFDSRKQFGLPKEG